MLLTLSFRRVYSWLDREREILKFDSTDAIKSG